ncbi:hypothetical protein [Micromonospora citrea]|uniref:hypothetical protein n=1 Tax=Micromonospora citrea TaxID=47855 RepID=UPI00114D2329|nr:hypothetical protein [Micromonospora citrea]
MPVSAVHTIAYFTDALAPIWDIPLVEGQVLKKKRVPISPELQAAIDELVGRAVFLAGNVRHVPVDGSWSLDADYSLNAVLGRRIVDAMDRDLEYRRELAFVQEVVLALAGLGVPGLSVAAQADATYSDPNIDFGGIVDLDNSEEITRTSQVTKKFAELVGQNHRLTEAELTHLYVRHLYSLLRGRSD